MNLSFANVFAVFIALAMAEACALPCPTMLNPLTPKSGPPPKVSAGVFKE